MSTDESGENSGAAQTVEQLRSLCKRADAANPKPEDRAALTRFFDEHPTYWRSVGDIGRIAEEAILSHVNGAPSIKTSLSAGAAGLRRDLGYAGASPMERLLIQEATCCWLQVGITRHKYEGVLSDSHTLAVGVYWERRLAGAQRRFLRAVETLAKIRKLGVAVTVNINNVGQQLNVAASLNNPGKSKGAPARRALTS